MNNHRIAEVFDELANLLEFQAANPFRIRAYRNGARVIRDLGEPLTAIIEDCQRELTEIDGIGKDLAGKITTLIKTGELPQRNKLLAQIPESILALLRIPGLGPKKAAALFEQLGIKDLDGLRAACQEGRVSQLAGFGKKTEQVILDGIEIAAAASQRVYWSRADQIVQALRDHMSDCPGLAQLEFAGSYRRGRETVGDLDLLVVSSSVDPVMDRFGEFPDAASVTSRGATKMSIRLESGFQVDLRVVPSESFGAALQYFTGSRSHNVKLRGLAKQRGLKINEYGVYKLEQGREQYLAGRNEQEVYATLDLPCIPPELREARREFEWAEQDRLPKLIELRDIRGDLHMHTTATDGKATLEEMIQAARQRELSYIAITDHSQRVAMASGLDAARLLAQWQEIDQINDRLGNDFVVLKGIECDILEDGALDLPDEVLGQADWVLAAIHYGQQQSQQKLTGRLVAALENPHVHAIAHPTGRLLNRRDPYLVDMDRVLQVAREHGKIMECNASPARLDLNDVHCAAAKAQGVPLVINTDAHSTLGLDRMQYGIMQARRAGLSKQDVVNTRSLRGLKKLLGR